MTSRSLAVAFAPLGLVIATCVQLSCAGQGLGVVGNVYTYPNGSRILKVDSVLRDGVARSVGVQPGDTITHINGFYPADAQSNQRWIDQGKGRLEINVIRGGQRLTLTSRVSASRPIVPANPGGGVPGGTPAGIGAPAGIGSPGGAVAALKTEDEAREAANYVISHWMASSMRSKVEYRLDQLFASRPVSGGPGKALQTIVVPYYAGYISKHYRASAMFEKVRRAIDILGRCEADANAAAAALTMIAQKGGVLGTEASLALESIQSLTIYGEVESFNNNILKLKNSPHSIRVPSELIKAVFSARWIKVKFNRATGVALEISPAGK